MGHKWLPDHYGYMSLYACMSSNVSLLLSSESLMVLEQRCMGD